ncbi:putative casparian strip membrane protein [Helianthus annuus]|nr:putative casparian strip membrane protein [Helianthus annuus]
MSYPYKENIKEITYQITLPHTCPKFSGFGFRVYSLGSGLIVSTYLILAAGAVTTELAFLAYKGDVTVTWSEACGTYGHFCKQATASIIITFLVVICYILLSLISSYRLFSKYDAPVGYRNKGIEIVDFGN